MHTKKITGYLYLLHELANFLHRGLFEFQQFGLLEKLLLHVDELALELLQSLPPLLAKPGTRWSVSDKGGSQLCDLITTSTKKGRSVCSYLAWLVSFFAD